MTILIDVTFSGVDEAEFLFNSLNNKVQYNIAKRLKTVFEKGRQNWQFNVHVITGNYQRSIDTLFQGFDHFEIFAGVDYAVYEEARGGTHVSFQPVATYIEYSIIPETTEAILESY